MKNFISSNRIKKKILLYCVYGINLILISLIINLNLRKNNQKNVFDKAYPKYEKFDLNEITSKKKLTLTNLISLSEKIKKINQENITDSNYHKYKLKFLQVNNITENLQNMTSIGQFSITLNHQNKKELLLIYNIIIYMLYLFVCFADLKIFILTFLFILIISIEFYCREIIIEKHYICFHLLINSMFLCLMYISLWLYKKLIEVLDYHFYMIKFLFENFYSKLENLGIFHSILEEEVIFKNVNNKDSNLILTKSLFGKKNHSFTSRKIKPYKNSRKITKNIRIKNKSHKKFLSQTHEKLINDNSITNSIHNFQERLQNERTRLNLNVSNNFLKNNFSSLDKKVPQDERNKIYKGKISNNKKI